MSYFNTRISKKQASDTGMAMVLILLLLGLYYNQKAFYIAGTIALVVNMIAPVIFYPVAIVWLGIANMLGTVVSRIILSVVFFLVVFPVAMIRRAAGRDSLYLRKWRQGNESVMKIRDHWYSPGDLEKPF